MPKKSRKGRQKFKRRVNPSSLAVKDAGQSPQPLSALPKQASVAKSPVTTAEQPVRYPYIVADIKRIGITAGAVFALLIILYFIFR